MPMNFEHKYRTANRTLSTLSKVSNFAPWLHLLCPLSLLPHPSGAGDGDYTEVMKEDVT